MTTNDATPPAPRYQNTPVFDRYAEVPWPTDEYDEIDGPDYEPPIKHAMLLESRMRQYHHFGEPDKLWYRQSVLLDPELENEPVTYRDLLNFNPEDAWTDEDERRLDAETPEERYLWMNTRLMFAEREIERLSRIIGLDQPIRPAKDS